MRRNTILALLGLLTLAAVHSGNTAQQPAAGHVSRVYDVTELVGGEPTRHPEPEISVGEEFDSPTSATIDNSSGTFGAHDGEYPGFELERLNQIVWLVAESATGDRSVVVNSLRAANRKLLRAVAPVRAHEEISLVLGQLLAAASARIRVTAYLGDVLIGSTSGRIGSPLTIGAASTRQLALDNWWGEGAFSRIAPEPWAAFENLSLSALTLPDGRIRLQGWYHARTEMSVRTVPTPRRTMELPAYRVVHVPIVADVTDPGSILIPMPHGPALTLHARCGQTISHFDSTLSDGASIEYCSALGALRRDLFLRDPTAPPAAFHSLTRESRTRPFELAALLQVIERFPPSVAARDPQPMSIGHLVCLRTAHVGDPYELRGAWKDLLETLNRSTPATYRVRVWNAAVGVDPDAVQMPGDPAYMLQASALQGQTACTLDVQATRHLADYDLPALADPVVIPFRRWQTSGSYFAVSKFGGRVMATFCLQQEVAPITRFTTTDDASITRTIEHTTTARRVFEWDEALAPGESATAIQPAEDGKVWVARLERLS